VADGFIGAHAVQHQTARNLFHHVASTQQLSRDDVQKLQLLVDLTYYTSVVIPAAAADERLFRRRVDSGAYYSAQVLEDLDDLSGQIEANWAATAPGASQSNGVEIASHFYAQVVGHIDAQFARGVMGTAAASRLKDHVENLRLGAEPNGMVTQRKVERFLLLLGEYAGDGERHVANTCVSFAGEATRDSQRRKGQPPRVLPFKFATYGPGSTNAMPFNQTGAHFLDNTTGIQTLHGVFQTMQSDRSDLAVDGSGVFDCRLVLGCDTRPRLGEGAQDNDVLADWWASIDDHEAILRQIARLQSATVRVSMTADGQSVRSVHSHVLIYVAASKTGTGPDAPSELRNLVLRYFEANGLANQLWVDVRFNYDGRGASAALTRLGAFKFRALCALLSVLHSLSAQTLNRCHCRTALANCI
jgi:hypothetical protein